MFYNFIFILQYLFFTLGSEIAKSDNCVNMSLYFYAFLEVKKEKEYMVHEKCKTLLEFHKVLHISAGLSVLKIKKILRKLVFSLFRDQGSLEIKKILLYKLFSSPQGFFIELILFCIVICSKTCISWVGVDLRIFKIWNMNMRASVQTGCMHPTVSNCNVGHARLFRTEALTFISSILKC